MGGTDAQPDFLKGDLCFERVLDKTVFCDTPTGGKRQPSAIRTNESRA
jgi:hypothetical protein